MQWDYVPVRQSNYQDSSYVVTLMHKQVTRIRLLVVRRIIALVRNRYVSFHDKLCQKIRIYGNL